MKFKIHVKYSAYLPNRNSKTTLATLENIQFTKASQDKDDYTQGDR